MIDAAAASASPQPHAREEQTTPRPRTTGFLTWTLIIGVALALLLARLPRFLDAARSAIADAAADLDDAALTDSAVTIGAVTAVGVHVVVLVVVAALATLAERLLGPRALGERVRIGVAGAVFAVLVLVQQVLALVLAVPAVERGWPLWAGMAAVSLVAPLLFPDSRASRAAYAKAVAAGGGIGALLCLG